MAKHIEFYKGGRWWLPSSLGRDEFYESVFTRGSFVHQMCSNYALTNLLFGFCRSVWIIDSLVTCPSPHFGALAHPSTLEVLRAKERTPTLYPSIVFTFRLVVLFIKEFESASLSLLLTSAHNIPLHL
jgi:hypothetical protein